MELIESNHNRHMMDPNVESSFLRTRNDVSLEYSLKNFYWRKIPMKWQKGAGQILHKSAQFLFVSSDFRFLRSDFLTSQWSGTVIFHVWLTTHQIIALVSPSNPEQEILPESKDRRLKLLCFALCKSDFFFEELCENQFISGLQLCSELSQIHKMPLLSLDGLPCRRVCRAGRVHCSNDDGCIRFVLLYFFLWPSLASPWWAIEGDFMGLKRASATRLWSV